VRVPHLENEVSGTSAEAFLSLCEVFYHSARTGRAFLAATEPVVIQLGATWRYAIMMRALHSGNPGYRVSRSDLANNLGFWRLLDETKYLLPEPIAACPQAASILALSNSNPARP
jgi:hypothetical protein